MDLERSEGAVQLNRTQQRKARRAHATGIVAPWATVARGATARAAAAVQVGAAVVAAVALLAGAAHATPQYAARAGRACDNCHLTPNGWTNPRLAERKCTLSCQGCHVDPAGGGMRTVSGRFYGRATLPMIATSPRPTVDWDRNLPVLGRRDRATTYTSRLPLGPDDLAGSRAYADSVRDRWAWGTPMGGESTRLGFWQGRYGTLRADPLVRVGLDARVASLVTGGLVFPMQFDVPVQFHPAHHVTFFANPGVRGRRSGYQDAFDDPSTPYLREGFVMLHELPMQAYAKAGRFVPSFGLRLDDHTTRTRRGFELDASRPDARVTGVEIGAAPNYPYVQASYFRMTSRTRQPARWDILDTDRGWGVALNAGVRELAWGVGASWMARRRPGSDGGDHDAWGAYGYVNLWTLRRGLPVVILGEYDAGRRTSATGRRVDHSAALAEIDWIAFNGVEVVGVWDFEDPDHDVRSDHSHRLQAGLRVTPYPGVTIDARVRGLLVAGDGDGGDVFIQLHLYK